LQKTLKYIHEKKFPHPALANNRSALLIVRRGIANAKREKRKKIISYIGKESNKNSHKKSSHATLITVISQVNL
jgi:hypothetical protein